MNRSGSVPQQMRMPVGYVQQPQAQQPGRVPANRIPNGNKMANAGWAFGGAVPMGAAGMQAAPRPLGLGTGNVSFAQSLGAAQNSTTLDPSDFPSLSNNPQLQNAAQHSLWATAAAGPRNVGPVPRAQGNTLASHLSQQEDPFSADAAAASRLHSAQVQQGSFRFGNQGNMGIAQPPQPPQMPSSSIEDFPPLNNRGGTVNDIAQAQNIALQAGGGSAAAAAAAAPVNAQSTPGAQSRAGNGLLNALSANITTSKAPASSSPAAPQRQQESRPATVEDPELASASEAKHPHGAIGNDQGRKTSLVEEKKPVPVAPPAPEVHDPLGGMPEADKWGLKGLITLMDKYPDYHAMVSGIDVNHLGLDLGTNELISTHSYSLFDDVPPRPTTPKFRLPECYQVTNVQPIDQVFRSFNEESLFWIFYSCTQDVRQHMAAVELQSRNWRWHRKLAIWITKDEIMVPQAINANEERGYYVVWDKTQWRKERRELILSYADLEAPAHVAAQA